jgi:transcriptional regulator with XRE-family HTH domain
MNTTVKVPPRQRLSAERMRRRWSQLEVADQLGTTPGNVSRWERGLTSPGPYFRRKLCELFGKSAQELGLSWDESDDTADHNTYPSASVEDMSLRSTRGFPGDEDLLAHLSTLLRPDPTTLPGTSASSDSGELNPPEHEHMDQGGLVRAITQWLQARSNLVLIVDRPEAVVIVAPKEKVC